MRIRDLRLHAASGAHFQIPDAKTDAGVREVQVSPDLLEELVAHVDRLGRADLPTDPDAYLFPNDRGGRMSRQRANELVREAAELASSHLAGRGLPALPNPTPHTLRRMYISVALLANRIVEPKCRRRPPGCMGSYPRGRSDHPEVRDLRFSCRTLIRSVCPLWQMRRASRTNARSASSSSATIINRRRERERLQRRDIGDRTPA
jgi:hypothetical protein